MISFICNFYSSYTTCRI